MDKPIIIAQLKNNFRTNLQITRLIKKNNVGATFEILFEMPNELDRIALDKSARCSPTIKDAP